MTICKLDDQNYTLQWSKNRESWRSSDYFLRIMKQFDKIPWERLEASLLNDNWTFYKSKKSIKICKNEKTRIIILKRSFEQGWIL